MDPTSARSVPTFELVVPGVTEEALTLLFREPYNNQGLKKTLQQAGIPDTEDHREALEDFLSLWREVLIRRSGSMFSTLSWPNGTTFSQERMRMVPSRDACHLLIATLPNKKRIGVRRMYASERMEDPGDLVVAWKFRAFISHFPAVEDLEAVAIGYKDKNGNVKLFDPENHVAIMSNDTIPLTGAFQDLCRLCNKEPVLSIDLDADVA